MELEVSFSSEINVTDHKVLNDVMNGSFMLDLLTVD